MQEVDVIVVGGGPGGSTAATLIAMQGRSVLLLERERFPRYHIGESLLPATVHGICAMLGVSEEIERANFVVKRGGTLRWGKRPEPWTFAFGEAKYNAGRPAFAYQVERSKFDDILLRNAARKGVDVREGHTVREVLFEDGRAVGVVFVDQAGAQHVARASYVIDASGASGLLANRIGTRVYDKFFKNLALFGYFEGGKRFPEQERRGNILSAAFDEGWFWYIPLSAELTSVGAVVSVDHANEISTLGMEGAFRKYVDACPIIEDFLSTAKRVETGDYGKLRVLRDFSYLNTSFWTPGAVLIGDAACFIDPVFSSGVHLATYSGLLAARSINTCLRGQLPEQACFAEFERRYRREYGVFYDFLLGFYEMQQEETSYFWSARKILNAEETARESFVRLVAGLSNRDEPLFDDAEAFIQSAKNRGAFLEQLSDAASGGEMSNELRQETANFGRVFFRERAPLWDVEKRRREGLPMIDEAQAPIWDDGLVPTADGLHWRAPAAQV
jgi:halogenation protein CepH